MLGLFKAKPRLSSLIPNGLTDIHSHLLPGLDDGSKNMADTIFLLTGMKEAGISRCITTPHTIPGIWDNDREAILQNWEKTRVQLPAPVRDNLVGAASEYMLDPSLLQRLEKERLLCLKDDYLLVEMSYLSPPLALHDLLYELRLKGYNPVLAHPERYLYFRNDVKTLEKLKSDGCALQINLLSAVGYYGPKVLHFADQLLSRQLIDFVGSDIHHYEHILAFSEKVKVKALTRLEECMRKNAVFAA